jgi:hypothetical protein
MQLKELIYWSYFILFTVPLGILSCQDCNDCGPAENEPYVSFRFFNIDSLNKVEDTLAVLEDSLDKVIDGIDTGNTDLDTIRQVLEEQIDLYNEVHADIKDGKVKIDEVTGSNGEGPIYFRDSLTNDTLTIFPFPLDMNYDSCSYIIKMADMTDEVGVNYTRELDYASERIIVRIYELEVSKNSYDSAKIVCEKNRCNSNETKIYFYF